MGLEKSLRSCGDCKMAAGNKTRLSLFEWTDSSEEDWTLEQKVNAQLEILGASLDAHPLELVSEKIIGSRSDLDSGGG